MLRLAFLFLLFSIPATAQDSVRSATEANYRGGLPYFFAKIQSGQPVRVAYLGGSITRADGGWRDQTFRWLGQQYPTARFEPIMAAIGGTGSDFGAYRVGSHVLAYKPDLVFVEFAVNDQGRPSTTVKASMEGIVRQIRRANPETDICFVYTFSKPQLDHYGRGQFPVSASAMEAVADYYNLPSVAMCLPVVRHVLNGQMIMQGKPKDYPDKPVFSEDGVHPLNETGQRVYAETVQKHLLSLASVGKPGRRRLPKPLVADNLEKATLILADAVDRKGNWQAVDSVTTGKAYAQFLPRVYATTDTAASIRFQASGTSFGIVDVVGPGAGQIMVKIDNDPPRYLDRFDAYCTYYRMFYSLISGLKPGLHQVEIRLSPARLDKVAILKKRNQTMSNPKVYEPHAFYLGGILVQQ
ncbi:SGNH/GDSL hydrolase family protein [Rudanella lutea]|uniref:SGNH/GDSL hydrolase family protein n=1 Tax=Rudanella lutea TaxID=451374 RepID=UPI00037C6444|nr:SGNH/GDSL hydrolase family protein [Rudanella lutea]